MALHAFDPTNLLAFRLMSWALVATSATSGLSLFLHILHSLSFPSSDSLLVPPEPVIEKLRAATSAHSLDEGAWWFGVHLPSVAVGVVLGILLIAVSEAILKARILAFCAALRSLGFEERTPLRRLL